MYYYTNFEYLILAVLFANGRPWKKHVWTNWQLMTWSAILVICTTLLLFAYNDNVFIFHDDVPMPMSWKLRMGLLLIGNTGAHSPMLTSHTHQIFISLYVDVIALVVLYELVIFPAIVFCKKHRSAEIAAQTGNSLCMPCIVIILLIMMIIC